MKNRLLPSLLGLNLAFCASAFAGLNLATLTSQDSIIDASHRQASAPGPGYLVDENSGRIGTGGSFNSDTRDVRNMVLGFTLPTLDFSTISLVQIGFTIDNGRTASSPDLNDEQLDVYLIDLADPTTTGETLFYMGESGSEAIADTDYVGGFDPVTTMGSGTTTVDESTVLTLTGDALASFLGFYSGVNPTQAEASFRFNPSADWGILDVTRFVTDNSVATLTITTVPEPSTYALLGGLSALALVMFRRRLK